MTFPHRHQYVTVIGDCYGATERWQFGFRLDPMGPGNQSVADAVAGYVEQWWRSTTPYTAGVDTFQPSNTHRLTEVKVAAIDPDGTYPADIPSASHFYPAPIVGDFTPPTGQSAQQTMCVTLTTALPRGLASKGRIFLPPSYWYKPGSDGLMTAADALKVGKSIQRLINAINADSLVGLVSIFSRGRGEASYDAQHKRVEYTYPNPGAVNAVTGVKVGRVVDTQRRRRRALPEGYQLQPL